MRKKIYMESRKLFREKLEKNGLTLQKFCDLTQVPYRTALDWKSGRTKVPNIVFAWFELYELLHSKEGG